MGEEKLVHMDREVELERWREAGKEVGRKLGVIQERRRNVQMAADLERKYEYWIKFGRDVEQGRIIEILLDEQTNWTKPQSFSYRNALQALIEKITNES